MKLGVGMHSDLSKLCFIFECFGFKPKQRESTAKTRYLAMQGGVPAGGKGAGKHGTDSGGKGA